MMRCLVFASLVGFAVALSGCQNEPEETPSITEAIPLDPEPAEGELLGSTAADEETNVVSNPPAATSTMESGSNPEGMIEPPAGSKVQPAN